MHRPTVCHDSCEVLFQKTWKRTGCPYAQTHKPTNVSDRPIAPQAELSHRMSAARARAVIAIIPGRRLPTLGAFIQLRSAPGCAVSSVPSQSSATHCTTSGAPGSRPSPRSRPKLTMTFGIPGTIGSVNLNCCTSTSGRLNTSVPAKVARTPSRKPRTKLRLAVRGRMARRWGSSHGTKARRGARWAADQ